MEYAGTLIVQRDIYVHVIGIARVSIFNTDCFDNAQQRQEHIALTAVMLDSLARLSVIYARTVKGH